MDDLGEKLKMLLSDPESMQNLAELTAMFRQPEEIPPPEHSPQQPDMTKLLAVGQVLAQGGSDDTEQLILALKPHLSAARAERAAKAARMLHLWHMVSILRESGLIGEIL